MAQTRVEESPPTVRMPLARHSIRGGGGIQLQAQEWGNPEGPNVLFIHGWSQSHLCWQRQVASGLADDYRLVTFDNRGHGNSARPLAPEQYTDPQLWAEDIAAISSQLDLSDVVLVAWSYGGFIVADYLRTYGTGNIAGINLVAAAVLLKPTFDHIGSGFLENAGDASCGDLLTEIRAINRFLRSCTSARLDGDDWDTALSWNMIVPGEVRRALISRVIDNDDVLSSLRVPVLVTHGLADTIVLPSMTEHVLSICHTAEATWYDGIGHMPFWEDAERFNRELSNFIART